MTPLAPTDYVLIEQAVQRLIHQDATQPDPTIRAYMIARAALVYVLNLRGSERAGELAYGLADEVATHDGGCP